MKISISFLFENENHGRKIAFADTLETISNILRIFTFDFWKTNVLVPI